jgi:neutral ceramidase
MPSVVVPANWTNSSKPMQLCRGALGDSFAGGTTDGPGAFDFTQGTNTTNKNPYWNFIADFIFDATEEDKACQAPKPILLNVGGLNFPAPWAPSTLPLQIFRIGTLYLVGVPGEFTTMSGRRLRNAVTAALESAGAQQPFNVVIAGLTNSYSHYIATYEEYLDQRYEAASTLYGPNTLAAYEYLYSGLAMDLQLGVTPPAGPPPPYLNFTFTFLPPVVEDRLPSGKNFGDVLEDVSSSPYSPGDAVYATFQGANPRNNLRTQDSFLRVEMSVNGGAQWNPVLLDGDWETKFHWAKGGLMESVITLEWDIPSWTPSGTYRLRYNGDWKALNGTITTFTGVSSSFQVVNNNELWA